MAVHISFNGSVARIEGLDPIVGEALHSNLREYWQEGIQKALDTVGEDFPTERGSLIKAQGKDWVIKTGLLSCVCKKLKGLKIDFTLTKNINEATFTNSPYADKPRKFEAYDYQAEGAEKCLKSKRGYVEVPTGGGKSVLIAEMLARFGENDRILVTVPSILLLHQMRKDIMEYLCIEDEDEIGLIGESKFKPKRITVAIGDSLYEGIKRSKAEIIDYLQGVVGWIGDECLPANTLVLTDKGPTTLFTIIRKPSDYLVLSYNEGLDTYEYKPILNTFRKGLKEVSRVNIGGRGRQKKLISTSNHLYLTGRGWIQLKDLIPGDWIRAVGSELRVLSDTQKSIVVGSILGDGCLKRIGDYSYRLRVTNGEKQELYLSNKASAFPNCARNSHREGYTDPLKYVFTSQQFYLPINSEEEKVSWAIENIDDLALSIMWADDGSLGRDKEGNPQSGRLYSCMSDQENCLALSNKLNTLYGMTTKVTVDKAETESRVSRIKDLYIVSFDKESINILLDVIDKYAQPSIEYKYRNPQIYYLNSDYTNECYAVKSIDIDVEKLYVYDIEVADNHNFLIKSKTSTSKKDKDVLSGFSVVHNCHLTLNATYFSIASELTNIQYAIGLSATPFDNHLFLEALYGPKLLTITPDELVLKK